MDGTNTHTLGLMEEETRIEAERRTAITRLTLEIEEMLIRENLSMGDLAEIMDMFNARAHSVFSQTKIKSIKDIYDRRT